MGKRRTVSLWLLLIFGCIVLFQLLTGGPRVSSFENYLSAGRPQYVSEYRPRQFLTQLIGPRFGRARSADSGGFDGCAPGGGERRSL